MCAVYNEKLLVPLTFLLYQFSLLLFVACFTVVFVVDNDCQKRKLSGTDRTCLLSCLLSLLIVCRCSYLLLQRDKTKTKTTKHAAQKQEQ